MVRRSKDPNWNMGFDVSMCLTSTMLKTAEKLKVGQRWGNKEEGPRAYSSKRVDKNWPKCNMGFWRITKIHLQWSEEASSAVQVWRHGECPSFTEVRQYQDPKELQEGSSVLWLRLVH